MERIRPPAFCIWFTFALSVPDWFPAVVRGMGLKKAGEKKRPGIPGRVSSIESVPGTVNSNPYRAGKMTGHKVPPPLIFQGGLIGFTNIPGIQTTGMEPTP